MIYKCNICGDELLQLETGGDEVNLDFVCQSCLRIIKETLRRAQEIEALLLNHLRKTT